MCFSLPESNSFPGPRQLHINWPRRQCQGCSAQVLWRCHRQLNIDPDVRSYPLCLPVSLSLSPSSYLLSSSPLPLHTTQSLHAWWFVCFSVFHKHIQPFTDSSSSLSLFPSLIPRLTFLSLRLPHSHDTSSPFSVCWLLLPLCVSSSLSLSGAY